MKMSEDQSKRFEAGILRKLGLPAMDDVHATRDSNITIDSDGRATVTYEFKLTPQEAQNLVNASADTP